MMLIRERENKTRGQVALCKWEKIKSTPFAHSLFNPFNWISVLALVLVASILLVNTRIIQAQNLDNTLVLESTLLLDDNFDRPDNEALENGWSEVETAGAQIGIHKNRMCFMDTSDITNRPIAQFSFQQVSRGELLWSFDFDWARLFREGTYQVLMQMGEGALMSDDDQNAGVGVNLVWGQISGIHETLAYRKGDFDTSLIELSGQAIISARVDLDIKTYDISVGSVVIQRDIPFDNHVDLDRVRFLTDGLNEVHFSGRCFDNLFIQNLINVATPTPTAITTPTPTDSDVSTDTPTPTSIQVDQVPLYGLAEIILTGPDSIGLGTSNPFQTTVNVIFTGPQGQEMIIPGFYDGDGAGGMNGNIWKVHFSPDAIGTWSYTSVSVQPLLSGQSGAIEVFAPMDCLDYEPGALPNFSCMGRLQYAQTHYLGFSNGDYWIKGGIDDPENFLGTAFGDWDAKKDAIDFLSSMGVNSIYVMTNTIGGDSNDIWPWVGASPQEAMANSDRFDLAKLLLWEDIFTYIESKGMALHLVLNDDSGWTGYDHDLYFREIVARFGHHPSIIWNIGEEANEIYTDSEQIALAAKIKALDPYNHPITVHRKPLWPFLGNSNFDLASIQAQDGGQDFSIVDLQNFNTVVIQHREEAEVSLRPIPIMIDEIPRVTIVNDEMRKKLRTKVLYPIYLAGGNYELHYHDASSQGGTVSLRDLGPMLSDMRYARSFVEALPYWEMHPMNELIILGQGYVFGKESEIYSAYLPAGGQIDLDLSATSVYFEGSWFNPRDGSYHSLGYVQGGDVISFTSPSDEDWMLLLRVSLVTSTPTDTSTNTPIPTATGTFTPTSTPTTTFTPTLTATETSTTIPSATHTPTLTNTLMPTAKPGVLFSDTFDRADSSMVGNEWIEMEAQGAQVGIEGNRMCFLETSNVDNLPMVRNGFSQVSEGLLIWEFDFDWTWIKDERWYWLFMQLGEGPLMNDDVQDEGIGVNLLWSRYGFAHEMLSFRRGGVTTGMVKLSGLETLRIEADVSAQSYTVYVNGLLIRTGIPFDNKVNLDTVRFFTDSLSGENILGRCFDNLTISR